jgi:O-acetyl-ADP-ribose deacetylase (regulator of RNase III)
MKEFKRLMDGKITVKTGDITIEPTDAIVNAANSSLMGGGGVDGAIHRAGGQSILEECRHIRNTRYPDGLPTGEAVETSAGNLPSRYVIHTVGPVWKGGNSDEENLLANAYCNSLQLADKLGLKSIAFPAISTGVYGFPKERAAKIAGSVLAQTIPELKSLQMVTMVFFSEEDFEIFVKNCEL